MLSGVQPRHLVNPHGGAKAIKRALNPDDILLLLTRVS